MERLKDNDSDKNSSYTKKYQAHIPCSFVTKLFALMIELASQLFFTEEKHVVNKFIKTILKKYGYCKKSAKKYFNRNLKMSPEDEDRFQ